MSCGETSLKFHGPTPMLERLQYGVLADAGRAAEQYPVVDLDGGVLDAVRAVGDDVVGVVGVDPLHQFDPAIGVGRVAVRARSAGGTG